MDVCVAAEPGTGFISSVTSYVDCQAQILGSGAWAALQLPGSTLQIVLTGFLTIFIALIGYNLLLGANLTVRQGTLAFVKIGAVFALATSWPAYRTIVYDLVTNGPSQLVREIGPRSGVGGSDGTLPQRLDLSDHALVQLSILGPGMPPANSYQQLPPAPFGGFDAFALGGSRILFLLTATASLAVVRIITGLMLALGPFFIAFLLFEGTRSLFEGWIRVLGGAGLAAIGVSIALGLELAFLDPWLSSALARRMADEALPTLPTELFVLICLFTLLVLAALYSCAWIARGFRLPANLWVHLPDGADEYRQARSAAVPSPTVGSRDPAQERTRAAAIAGVIQSSMVRERSELIGDGGAGPAPQRTVEVRGRASESHRQSVPLGRSFSRRPGARMSAIAAKRDAAQ